MKLRNGHIVLLGMVAIVIILAACSTQKNTGKTRFWQSFSAKYNTYYNGTLAYIDGSLEKENGNKDNYTEMIPLYTVGNKNSQQLGKGNFDKAIEKCEKTIKLHSIKKKPEWTKKRRKTEKDIEWLNRKEYNPMMWKAWLLMGRSQFYQGDYEAASATFSYMSRLYQTQPAIYGKARAWLAKCYIEEDWLYDAEDIIRNMGRDSIHWSAKKEWDYTYADYYIHTGDYASAVPYLRQVIKHEMRKKQKARECFLLGQLYERLGQNDEAYKAYRKVIRQNPPYELEFNARIAMTEVAANNQGKQMISKLKRMARNDNNADYLDQVYYAIGNIYMTQNDTINAISAYEKGNKKSTRNGVEKGVLLLRLGDIYWDMEKYGDAGRCYGEAIGLLDKDRKDYEQLADRSKKLDELVPYTDAVHLQDSLLELSVMSEKDRLAAIDRVIEELKKKEKEEKKLADEQNAAQVQNQNGGNQNGNQNSQQQKKTTSQQNEGQWYFYNQMSVNQGKTAFQKQWGKRDNVDHWQRSNQTVVSTDNDISDDLADLTDEQRDSIAAAQEEADKQAEADSLANDPHKREYYLAQIPFTDEQKDACHAIIMDGLYNSGVIFKDKLDNLKLSEKQFGRLVSDYPNYEGMDNAYYHMFLLYSRLEEPQVAEVYVEKLKEEFPDSKWTTLLSDPNFVENQKFGVHMEDSLYAATYLAFKADRFSEVKANTKISTDRFPLGANRDKFVFISGLSKLNSGDADGCLSDMQSVVKDFPQSKLATMAGMIVNGVKEGKKLRGGRFDIGDVWARRSAVLNDSDSIAARQFTDDKNINFVFMVAYEPDSVNENQLLYELAKYNFTSYMVRNFDLELEDQDGLRVMLVSGFNNYDEALEYAHQFYKQDGIVARLGKSRTFVISEKNRELLGVNFSYDDYDKYYSEHFSPIETGDLQRLNEPSGTGEDLDDGGSVPGNISPILLNPEKKADEQTPQENADEGEGYPIEDNTTTVQPVDDNITIEDQPAVPVTPQVDDNITIEDQPAVPVTPQVDDNTVIIDEEPAKKAMPTEDDNTVIIDEEPAKKATPTEDDNTVIIDEEPAKKATPTEDDNTVVIEDEPSSKDNTTQEDDDSFTIDDGTDNGQATNDDDSTVILDDTSTDNSKKNKDDEGSEDEYFDLDGF